MSAATENATSLGPMMGPIALRAAALSGDPDAGAMWARFQSGDPATLALFGLGPPGSGGWESAVTRAGTSPTAQAAFEGAMVGMTGGTGALFVAGAHALDRANHATVDGAPATEPTIAVLPSMRALDGSFGGDPERRADGASDGGGGGVLAALVGALGLGFLFLRRRKR